MPQEDQEMLNATLMHNASYLTCWKDEKMEAEDKSGPHISEVLLMSCDVMDKISTDKSQKHTVTVGVKVHFL